MGKSFRAPSIGQGRPPASSPVVLVFIGSDGAEPAWAHIQTLPFSGFVTPGKSLNCLVPPILYLLRRSPTQRADELNVVCPTVLKTVPGPWSVLQVWELPLLCCCGQSGPCWTVSPGGQEPVTRLSSQMGSRTRGQAQRRAENLRLKSDSVPMLCRPWGQASPVSSLSLSFSLWK